MICAAGCVARWFWYMKRIKNKYKKHFVLIVF